MSIESIGGNMVSMKYVPSDEALKFIAFIRASANESNVSPEVHYRIADALFSDRKADRKVLIECTRGLGKALALDELVYTPEGTKTIRDVQIGDSIYDHRGLLTKVINKSSVFIDDTYEVELADGNIITACKDHQWQVFTGVKSRRTKEYIKKEHILSSEYLCSNQWYDKKVGYRNPAGREQKYSVKLTEPIQYEHKDVPLDPYTVGVILGDGSVCNGTGYARITSHNNDVEEVMSYIPYDKGVNCTPDRTSSFIGILGVGSIIKGLGLNVNTYNKFIPDIYKRGSIEQRLELLRGLMDTDGTIGSKPSFGSSFSSCNEKLAKDVQELARSLGMSAKLSYRDNGYAGHYRVYIQHRNYNIFKLKRKADMVRFPAKHIADYQKIKEIRKVATVPTQCISVDNEDKLFVTSGYAVTHNSTTVEYAVIYAAAMGEWPGFGKVPFVAFLGASQEGNVKQFFRNVANKIEKSTFISSVLSVKRVTDNEIELVNADGVEMMIVGRGMSTNFRGLRSKSGDRPTLIIADDILSNEVATSDAIRETIDTNWYNSVIPALDPTKHKVIFIGTPIGQKDLLSQIKESGTYRVEKYPLCSKFPCAESEFDSIWPDRFTYEYTVDTYKQYESAGRTQGFYQEYLLEVTDLSTLLVEEDDIKWYDPSIVLANKHAYNFYISTDFATSTKKSADYSTIAVWAISYNNDWLLVDGQCKRQTMQENIEDLFGYVKKWKPLSVGIESSGQQGGFLSIIEEMKLQRNVWFQFAKKPGSKDPGIRPTKDKVHRFVTGVQPKFKQGKVWFPKPDIVKTSNYRLFELVEEMINELSKFTMAGGVVALKHDDAIDTLNQLSEMELFAPSDDSVVEKSVATEGGLVWTGIWEDDDGDEYGGSTVF